MHQRRHEIATAAMLNCKFEKTKCSP